MPRNTHAQVDWPTVGPRALAWLRETAPHRATHIGLAAECAATLGGAVTIGRLQDWLAHGVVRAEWLAIKATIGTANGAGPHALPGASAPSSPASFGLTILEDDRQRAVAEDRARCPVCKLPSAVREEIAEAKRAGLTQARILPALARVHNITIAPRDWVHHANGGHER